MSMPAPAHQHTAEGKTILSTTRFGSVEIETHKIVTLTSPFLGFPDERQYVLIPHGPDSPFMWLQSISTPALAFVVIPPAIIRPDYAPTIPRQALTELGSDTDGDVGLLVMLTIPQGHPERMTANLLAPIAFCAKNRSARQILLDPALHDPCWPVFQGQETK